MPHHASHAHRHDITQTVVTPPPPEITIDIIKGVIRSSEDNILWTKERAKRLNPSEKLVSTHQELIPTIFPRPIISKALDTGGRRILFSYQKVKEKQQFKIRVLSKLSYVDTLVIKSHLILHHQIRIRSEIIPPNILTRSSEIKISTHIDNIQVKSNQTVIDIGIKDEEDSS